MCDVDDIRAKDGYEKIKSQFPNVKKFTVKYYLFYQYQFLEYLKKLSLLFDSAFIAI